MADHYKLVINVSTGKSMRVKLNAREVTEYNAQQAKSLAAKTQEVVDNAAKKVKEDDIKAKFNTLGINYEDLEKMIRERTVG